MGLIDFVIQQGAKRVDKRNLIRNMWVGFGKEDNTKMVRALIKTVVKESLEADAILEKWSKSKVQTKHIRRKKS